MSSEGKKIAVGVFCADWRLHQEGVHINNAVRKHLNVDAVDVIAVPGPDGICAVEARASERDILSGWLKILIGAHKPVALAFISHYNCAGHPVDNASHDTDTKLMMEYYKKALGFSGEMVALAATYENDASWPLKEIARISKE